MKRKRFDPGAGTGIPLDLRHRVRAKDTYGIQEKYNEAMMYLGLVTLEPTWYGILEEEYQRFVQDAVMEALFSVEDAEIQIGMEPFHIQWPPIGSQN